MQILFLHGLESGPHGAKFQALTAAFGAILAPDCSGVPDEEKRLRIIERDIALQPGPFLVVGSSMGGLMALLLQQAQPDRVAGMLLCAPALHRPAAADLPLKQLPPTRVIHGRHDRVVPLEFSRHFGERLLIVPDDHSLKKSLPQIVAATGKLYRTLQRSPVK